MCSLYAGGDTLCALCMPEAMRCVLLGMLETVESGLSFGGFRNFHCGTPLPLAACPALSGALPTILVAHPPLLAEFSHYNPPSAKAIHVFPQS